MCVCVWAAVSQAGLRLPPASCRLNFLGRGGGGGLCVCPRRSQKQDEVDPAATIGNLHAWPPGPAQEPKGREGVASTEKSPTWGSDGKRGQQTQAHEGSGCLPVLPLVGG